jgi:hypothetical protein
MLCDQVQQGVVGSGALVQSQIRGCFFRFDSRETPEMAAEKKRRLCPFRRPQTDSGYISHWLEGIH